MESLDFLKFLQESQEIIESSSTYCETMQKFLNILIKYTPPTDESLREVTERAECWLKHDDHFFALQAVWNKELGELLLDTGFSILDKNNGVYASRSIFSNEMMFQPIAERRPKFTNDGALYSDGVNHA